MKLIATVLGCCAMMVCSVAGAGSLRGPGSMDSALDAGRNKTFRDFFEGGRLATLSVTSSNPNGDIDCHLLDEDHDIVASEFGLENTCDFAWVPQRSAAYYVRVFNNGERPVVVTLSTN